MKWFGLLLLCCMLCCCGQNSMTNDIVDSVNTSIVALNESLSKECKTKSIEAQIINIQKQVSLFGTACESDIKVVRTAKTKWQTAFFGLLLMVLFWFFVKAYKKI